MFSPTVVDKGVKFLAAAVSGRFFCWYRCPLDVIYDSRIQFEIIFYMSPGHVAKDPYLIAWSRVRLVGQQMIWW